MGRGFDFMNIPRKFWDVTLPDGTLLLVKMPQKRTFEKIQAFQNMQDGEVDALAMLDTLDDLIAEILSNNKAGKKITKKYVAETEELDFEAKQIFLAEYMEFVAETQNDPK